MKFFILFLSLVIVINLSLAQEGENCKSSLLSDVRVQDYINFLTKIKNTSKLNLSFNLAEKPIFLSTRNNAKCFLLLNEVKIVKTLELIDSYFLDSEPNDNYNGFWSFLDLKRNYRNPPPLKFKKDLKDLGKTSALIIQISDDYMEKKNRYYWTSIHEGYHLFVQGTNYENRVDRDRLLKVCYDENLREEGNNLVSSFFELFINKDNLKGRGFLKSFLEKRISRYNSLQSERVDTWDEGKSVSCEEAEAQMEALEGTANTIAEIYMIELGLINLNDTYRAGVNFFKKRNFIDNEPFYSFGEFQLYMIRFLIGEIQFIEYLHTLKNFTKLKRKDYPTFKLLHLINKPQ